MVKKLKLLGCRAFLLLAISLLGMLATPALAQYSGYYGEGFYGSGDVEFDFFSDLSTFNADSNFYGLTLGRGFNDNLAFEVSYVKVDESSATISNPSVATLDSTLNAQTLALTFVGNYPISRSWVVFGKFGINQWDLDAAVTDRSSTPEITLSGSDRGTGINYSLGVQYRFTPRYSIKVEYQFYELNPELLSSDVVIGGPTIGARFNY